MSGSTSVQLAQASRLESFQRELLDFDMFGKRTETFAKSFDDQKIFYFVNEFWTAKQRAAHRLHEVSYRACFKPQLPRFFIERLTKSGDLVYDPFMGRGTTLIEAAILDRIPIGCDINPLSRLLCEPRLSFPNCDEVINRLSEIPTTPLGPVRNDLLVFYHRETLDQVTALREYLINKQKKGTLDSTDRWIRMVATNRLTGHSPGFFSVYTLPPNQALSVKSQERINNKRNLVPPRRDIVQLIIRKTRALLTTLEATADARLATRGKDARFLTSSADVTPDISANTIQLVVTSPPFLDVVNYKHDNWLRCWFNDIDPDTVDIWQFKKIKEWQHAMTAVFTELYRILRPGGFVAFEVGEVRNGSIMLEDLVVPAGKKAGLTAEAILINDQTFTKTSHCWGVDNLRKGTNTNRIVLFSRH